MGEEKNQSSLEDMEERNSKSPEEVEEEDYLEGKFDENEEWRRVSETHSSDCTAERSSSLERGESRPSQSETLTSVQISESGLSSPSKESSEFLSEVPVEYSLQPLQSVEELKEKVRVVSKEPLKGITGQSAEVRIQNQLQLPEGPSKLEPLPMSAKQSISSTLTPALPEKELQSVEEGNSPCLTELEKQNSRDSRPLFSVTMLKNLDGYNWRKYGQKLVKSPEGFRSYFRCTFSDCHAKKIECCDRSNHVMETVYRSPHNHDPPQKVNCARENKRALPVVAVNRGHDTTHSIRGHNDPIPSTSSKEPLVVIDQTPETNQQDSCDSDETTEINLKEEYVEGPEYKRRRKRSLTGESGSLPASGRKPKYVVHAAGDMGISGDGYRWRKYGQKMVKGNPHPRNYYRCSSAGCPVRKHIEKAMDNTGAVLITYKGAHDHDIPVPRKRHGPMSGSLAAAAAPVTGDYLHLNKMKHHHSQTHWSVGHVGEGTGGTLNLDGEKTSESARSLLSIGFEIKPC